LDYCCGDHFIKQPPFNRELIEIDCKWMQKALGE